MEGDRFDMGERVNDTLPLFIIPLTGCREDRRRLVAVLVFLMLLLFVKRLVFVDGLLLVATVDELVVVDDDAVDV